MSSIRPVYSATTRRPAMRTASGGDTNWGIDLPLPTPQPTRPQPRPIPHAPTPNTNVARLRGENLRYAGEGNHWMVDIPYLQADLLDLTPENPLTVWEFGTYKARVHAGQVRLSEQQVNAMIKSQLWQNAGKVPVDHASVEFRSGNQVKLKGVAKWGFVPIPFSVKAGLAVTSTQTVDVKPNSVRLFGIPLYWAIKLFNVDLASKLPLSPNGPISMAENHTVTVDLRKTDKIETNLTGLSIGNGVATITMGGARPESLRGARTGNNPNYSEVIAVGEVALQSAIIRNASVMIMDNTPEDGYSFNNWDIEGYARVESGHVILDEAKLRARFAGASEKFIMKKANLRGSDMVVEGGYTMFGVDWPIDFKLRFSIENGKLKMTPHDVRVVGFKAGRDMLMDTLVKLDGAVKSGDGILLDLRKAASVEMPPIKEMRTEPGRLVMVT